MTRDYHNPGGSLQMSIKLQLRRSNYFISEIPVHKIKCLLSTFESVHFYYNGLMISSFKYRMLQTDVF